jgi:DNA transposition AAA+ family ATPase
MMAANVRNGRSSTGHAAQRSKLLPALIFWNKKARLSSESRAFLSLTTKKRVVGYVNLATIPLMMICIVKAGRVWSLQ